MPVRPTGRGRASPPPRSKTPGRTAGARKLKEYRAKRQFAQTPEPEGKAASMPGPPRFTVQKHDATRLHYDLRLEVDGVLKSWAVPKGPSLSPRDRRLAVRTEDHPIEYLTFEGVIPDGQYGAGPMIVWDTGTYRNIKTDRAGREMPIARALEAGSLKIWLEGDKLRGGFALVRAGSARAASAAGKEQWFLIKLKDEHAVEDDGGELLEQKPGSVRTGKTIDDLGRRKRRSSKAAPKRRGTGGRQSASQKSAASTDSLATRGADRKPAWIAPMLATLVDQPPEGGGGKAADEPWAYEYKYDGFRALAFRDGDKMRLLSRNKKDLSDRFPEVADALARQPLDDFIIDGEIVAMRAGRPSFSELQKRLKATTLQQARRGGVQLRFIVFDLLYAAGHDARRLPLAERKKLLKRAIAFDRKSTGMIQYSEHIIPKGKSSSPARLLKKACNDEWEGLIAKRLNDHYTSGRSRSWLKLKCSLRQEFIIGGYTDPQGSREAFGALLVGYHESGELLYAGKVGTGYTDKLLREMLAMLRPLERKTSPFVPDAELPRRGKGVHFVQPQLVAEVGFTEWTHDHHIRHPRFLGLRPDKPPAEVRRERPAAV